MKRTIGVVALGALMIASLGWNPFAAKRDLSGLLVDDYSGFETGVHRQPNGIYLVRALTRMPRVKAPMVRWWFANYMQTTEHYMRWHPTAHVWMGDVSKRDGNETVFSIEGLVGDSALARMLLINETGAVDLMTHAIQEMGYLADFLPGLYTAETGETGSP